VPDRKITINLTELIKIITITITILGVGVPALVYVYKTYDKINFMFEAFYEAASPDKKARFKQ